MTARVLRCPSCGAAADPRATRCGYCNATLAQAACPSCFGVVFSGSRHCVHCGERVRQGITGDPTPRRCPRCPERPALIAHAFGQTSVDQCPECTGVFVDPQTLDRIIAHRDEAAVLTRDLAENVDGRAAAPFTDKVTYLKCAACDDLMLRSNFGRRSGVIVDTCKKHGVWFDADELRRVVAFVGSGGLDQARKQEIAELERKIATRKTELARTPRSSHEARSSAGIDVLDILFVLWP